MLDQNVIDEIVAGAVVAEVSLTNVPLDYETNCPLNQLAYHHKIPFMRDTWRAYLAEWLEENEELIRTALEAYNVRCVYPAWNLGYEVAHEILDRGKDFYTEKSVDAELAGKLDDSLDGYWCPDGMHEVWVENSELYITRWQ